MIDLIGKNLYYGSQEIDKAFLAGEEIYSSAKELVFPEPPTIYEERNIRYLVFYADGIGTRYDGTVRMPEIPKGATQEANGLHLNDSKFELITIKDAWLYTRGSFGLTIENYFPDLEPGETMRVFDGARSSSFGHAGNIWIERLEDETIVVKAGNERYEIDNNLDYINLFMAFENIIRGSSYHQVGKLYINGNRVIDFMSRGGREATLSSVIISGNIVLYDLQYYTNSTWPVLNYEGIKDLAFITTKQLK